MATSPSAEGVPDQTPTGRAPEQPRKPPRGRASVGRAVGKSALPERAVTGIIEQELRSTDPIFVDPSGARRRRVRLIAYAIGTLLILVLAAVWASQPLGPATPPAGAARGQRVVTVHGGPATAPAKTERRGGPRVLFSLVALLLIATVVIVEGYTDAGFSPDGTNPARSDSSGVPKAVPDGGPIVGPDGPPAGLAEDPPDRRFQRRTEWVETTVCPSLDRFSVIDIGWTTGSRPAAWARSGGPPTRCSAGTSP